MRKPAKAGRVGLPVAALAALLTATTGSGVGAAEPATGGTAPAKDRAPDGGPLRWQEDVAGPGGSAAGVRQRAGDLVLAEQAWARPDGGAEGHHTFPARQLGRAVNRISATVTAKQPAGSEVSVDVRGVGPNGMWTEWQPLTADRPFVAPFSTDKVQVRVTLARTAPAGAPGPEVSAVALTGDVAPAGTAATIAPAVQAPTYRVFATREGLVGHTTANGHVIQRDDHFVALPSRRSLNPSDQVRDYKVRVCNPRNGRCIDEPVWDVGPWNTKDDYWSPANVREMWSDLPRGKPEATAAYYQDYNNGQDEFGRDVANPSGIDLADGTWAAIGMTDNDFVDVTYLWLDS